MNRVQLEDRVRRLVSDMMHVPVAELTAASSPSTIAAWDSVQNLNLVLSVEEEFALELEPEEMQQMNSVGEIVRLLLKRLGESA